MSKTRTPLDILVENVIPDEVINHLREQGHLVYTDQDPAWLDEYDIILGPNCRTYIPEMAENLGLVDFLVKQVQKGKKSVEGNK